MTFEQWLEENYPKTYENTDTHGMNFWVQFAKEAFEAGRQSWYKEYTHLDLERFDWSIDGLERSDAGKWVHVTDYMRLWLHSQYLEVTKKEWLKTIESLGDWLPNEYTN